MYERNDLHNMHDINLHFVASVRVRARKRARVSLCVCVDLIHITWMTIISLSLFETQLRWITLKDATSTAAIITTLPSMLLPSPCNNTQPAPSSTLTSVAREKRTKHELS